VRATGFVLTAPFKWLSHNGTVLSLGPGGRLLLGMFWMFALYSACAIWLKRRYHLAVISLLPLLLAASPATAPNASPRVSRVGTATVQIIRAESVMPKSPEQDRKQRDRQYRQRDDMPLVDFY
jgi:hypothetical protein